ncbi:MAG: alpha/beta hydrolase [Anaerolineaceae bacterium]|nr:alpha/beta hydrolase [Anaerolineaceae bacterium]
MRDLVLYVHGKGGSSAESEHFIPLFPDFEVIGLDYKTITPWDTRTEIREAMGKLKDKYGSIILIANSIGAYFCLNAGIDVMIRKAYFISPVVDMERLILDMMALENVSEIKLKDKGVIKASFGEELSWEYLSYVRDHPVRWAVPTRILYGRHDSLIPFHTVAAFSNAHGAELTVYEEGEHWFHTAAQMRFMDQWIAKMF